MPIYYAAPFLLAELAVIVGAGYVFFRWTNICLLLAICGWLEWFLLGNALHIWRSMFIVLGMA